ncbi:MAG: carboxypeptidase-like regulatory domain-containing protein [Planctomycetota bacterium]|jgi:hypothetical protein
MSEGPVQEQDLSDPPPVEGGHIAGRVTDFSGVPLAGVRVEAAATGGGDLDLLPTLTDGDGRFRLEGLVEGRYDLRFELGRVRARTLAVPVGTDQLRVQLARPQGILLVVKHESGQKPPSLLHVVLERHTKKGKVREHVGRHLTHRMLLWSIRPGNYTVTVWGGPYLPVQADGVEVREKDPAPEVQVLLAALGGTIEGRLLDASGEPVPGALVGFRPVNGGSIWPAHERTVTASGSGAFSIRGLPTGRYLVSAGTECGPIAETQVDVVEGGSTTVDLRTS